MNLIIFVSLLFTLQLFYWYIGRKASNNLKNKEDYFLAGKKVSFFPLMMTFLGTQIGGGLVLGAAEEAYQFGWSVLLYPLGAALGLMLLGLGIGRKLAQFPVSTVSQVLEVVYRSKMLKTTASILSITSLFMILIAQVIASHKFLATLGLINPLLFILFWGFVILYTVHGGLKAVISTDIIQAIFFSIIFLVCFGFLFYSIPSSFFQFPQLENSGLISSKFYGWLMMPLLFMVIEQDMAQRCFAGSSSRIVSKASLWAGIFTFIICIFPVSFGILAKTTGLEVLQGSSVLMALIIKLTNPWMAALMGCAILAAIISTASSLINAISSNLLNDFDLPFIQKKGSIQVIRGITALISIGALFFAFYFDNIVGLLIQSYELSVSCLFVPIFIALFKKRGNFLSALFAILLGASGFFLFRIFPSTLPKEFLSILFSFAGYYVGELTVWTQNKSIQERTKS